MSNKQKKELESELVTLLEDKLTPINKMASLKTTKTIKGLSKNLTKKFFKEIKRLEKKKKKVSENGRVRPQGKIKSKVKSKVKSKNKGRVGRPRKKS